MPVEVKQTKNSVFDINEYLQNNSVQSLEKVQKRNDSSLLSFDELVIKIREELNKTYDNSQLSDEVMTQRQQLEHNATIGVLQAEKMLISEIETMLRKQNLLGIKFPEYYDSLAHGIFHEIYRFGVLNKWEKHKESPSAVITGKEIWFKINGKFVRQEETMRDENHVDEIIRLLQIDNSNFKINESNPEGELMLSNGVRIKVLIPPLVKEPTIVFRRFIIDTFSFYKQADYQTIPIEDIEFHESLSNLYLNTIIAGHVESGKSTFLKTIYGSRSKDKVAILIESTPESFLKRDFPDRLVHELYSDESVDIHDLMRSALRIDHDYIIVQEVRGIEAEGAITATERGTRGTLMTYHITDPVKTPEQLAQHITDEFPNRNLVNEIRRIALQLDIGITMQTFENNKKKLTSVYEICYDFETDEAWINYLVKYDPQTDQWHYNKNISDTLKERMFAQDRDLANKVLTHLNLRSNIYPLRGKSSQDIHFK